MKGNVLSGFEQGRAPAHPGEVLKEDLLPTLRISQRELADILGLTRKTVNLILSGNAPVTPPTALKLGVLFRNEPQYWLALQAQHDLWHEARKLEANVVARLEEHAARFAPLLVENWPPPAPDTEASRDAERDARSGLLTLHAFNATVEELAKEGRPFALLVLRLPHDPELVPLRRTTPSPRSADDAPAVRLGDGEFAFLAERAESTGGSQHRADSTLADILQIFARQRLDPPAVGVALFPEHGASAAQLLPYARAAAELGAHLGPGTVLVGEPLPIHGSRDLRPLLEVSLRMAAARWLPFQQLVAAVRASSETAVLSIKELSLLELAGELAYRLLVLDARRVAVLPLLAIVHAIATALDSGQVPEHLHSTARLLASALRSEELRLDEPTLRKLLGEERVAMYVRDYQLTTGTVAPDHREISVPRELESLAAGLQKSSRARY